MARYFNTTEALTNLTLILFFVCPERLVIDYGAAQR
jgi:hypothetical protein